MIRYSEQRREAVLAKWLPAYNLSPREVAEQEGISIPTIYSWRQKARAEGRCLPDATGQTSESWSSRDKFNAVLETATMNAEEVSQYCRGRAIYLEQLTQWREDCAMAADLGRTARQRDEGTSKADRERIKELERELRRKDAALAETAGLLALRKKRRRSGARARSHDQHPGSSTVCRADQRSPYGRSPLAAGL